MAPLPPPTRSASPVPALDGAHASAPAPLETAALGDAAPAPGGALRAVRARRRARGFWLAIVLGALLFGSVPRLVSTVARPHYWPTGPSWPTAPGPELAVRRVFGLPFVTVIGRQGPSGRQYTINPLAVVGDGLVGGFVLAVAARLRRRRRGPTDR